MAAAPDHASGAWVPGHRDVRADGLAGSTAHRIASPLMVRSAAATEDIWGGQGIPGQDGPAYMRRPGKRMRELL
jgi:hypothetical protein